MEKKKTLVEKAGGKMRGGKCPMKNIGGEKQAENGRAFKTKLVRR